VNPIIKMVYLWKLKNLSALKAPAYFDQKAFEFITKYEIKKEDNGQKH
jgi:hypothetical protein